MYTTDQLQKQCFLDLLMAVYGRKETFSHVLILIRIFFDFFDFLQLSLCVFGDNLLPNQHLIEIFLGVIFPPFDLLIFLFELIELIIFYFDVDGNEDKLIAEIAHALDASHSSFSIGYTSSLIASSCQLSLLSWLQHTGKLRKHAKISDDLANVSRLAFLGKFIAQDDIDGPRHGSRRNFCWIFLYPNLLEISKSALGHFKFP